MKRRAAWYLILVGATASRRGGAKTVAFASAKAAQRSLAESLARSLVRCRFPALAEVSVREWRVVPRSRTPDLEVYRDAGLGAFRCSSEILDRPRNRLR